ncbi:MAG TPA: DsbA family protein [Acidimicrobiales bacterium]|nr:DsbA family protein [Acidimicrobiales bacterium]
MRGTETPTVEVFADIWCPFTHVGLRALAAERSRRGRPDVAIHVRSWPLELVNGAPLNATVTKEHVDHLREQVAPDLFRRFNPDRFPTSTLNALALVVRAHRVDPNLGERASFVLRDALFEQGLDISDRVVLEEIANDLGVTMPESSDHEQVIADWQEGQQRGVLGSPHFFCGANDAFCPSLDITKDPRHGVSMTRDASHLMQFLERCLERHASTS